MKHSNICIHIRGIKKKNCANLLNQKMLVYFPDWQQLKNSSSFIESINNILLKGAKRSQLQTRFGSLKFETSPNSSFFSLQGYFSDGPCFSPKTEGFPKPD